MKLSVVVLTYNQENTVAQALDSILSQEHPYSMEIIVGDDGSKDATGDIVRNYAARYPDIIKPIVRENNLGLIGNFFDTISHCTGEYIAVCAGDDCWLPGKVSIQIAYLDTHPECGLCYTKAQVFDTINGVFMKPLLGNVNNSLDKLLDNNHVPAISLMMRASFMKDYIRTISPERRGWLMEDYPLVLYAAGWKMIGFIPEETCVYNINAASITQSGGLTKKLKFEASVHSIRLFFARHFNCNKRVIVRLEFNAWQFGEIARGYGYKAATFQRPSLTIAFLVSPLSTVKGLLRILRAKISSHRCP